MANKDQIISLVGDHYNYERIPAEYARHLTLIPAEWKDTAKILRFLISQGKIHIMDMEHGIPMSAGGIVGYKNGGLVIWCHR